MARKVLLCTAAAAMAVAIACGKSSAPTSPTASAAAATTAGNGTSGPAAGGTDAASDGSTLKATAPAPVSPVNGDQPDTVVFVATKSTGKFADFTPSYEFQIRSGNTVVWDSGTVGAGGNGPNQVQYTPDTSGLQPETTYTWRARAVYQGANGPWSSDATFKTAVGAYLRDGELRDPLTIGRTVGDANGIVFTSEGAQLPDQTSFIRYNIGNPVETGEFSFLAKNIKSAAPGGKSKMMAIQEGFGDITDNDYRFTIEKRGSGYVSPGQVRYRIITGDAGSRVFDSGNTVINFDTSRWYFWQVTWTTGTARLIVRQDSDTGPIIVNLGTATGSHPYRPNPMVAYVGAPVGRAGPDDATVPRIIVKDVWLSSKPRPAFPN